MWSNQIVLREYRNTVSVYFEVIGLCFIEQIFFFVYSQEKLRSIATYLNLVPPPDKAEVEDWFRFDNDFLLELLV
jgi:hypothetical protein